MSSIAQEESRSISENVKWGKRKGYENGLVKFAWNNFLSYKKGADGKPEIDEEEAEVVRYIYNAYLHGGLSSNDIAKELTRKEILTPQGKKQWKACVVLNILKNEKYRGDALLQKTYCESYLTHKMIKNKGELQQYYVKNNHPAIIDEATWDLVQEEIEIRKDKGPCNISKNSFFMKIICANCDSHYGSQTWHAGTSKEKKMFVCYGRKTGRTECKSSSLSESYIQKAFLIAFKEIYKEKEEIKQNISKFVDFYRNDKILEGNISLLTTKISETEKVLASYQEKNGTRAYTDPYVSGRLFEMYDEVQDLNKELVKLNMLLKEKQEKERINSDALGQFEIEHSFDTFDKSVFNMVVEKALVYSNRDIEFYFIGDFKYMFKFDAEFYDFTKNDAKKIHQY